MEDIRAFVIDPDKIIRKRISDLIHNASNVSVAGSLSASDGNRLMQQLDDGKPDVAVMGIDRMKSKEMQVFIQIRKKFPTLPVIVLTPHSHKGAKVALETLKKGSVEFVTKTQNFSSCIPPDDHFTERLIPVIKASPRMNRAVLSGKTINEAMRKASLIEIEESGSLDSLKLLVIAGCLGGVSSLYMLMSALPKNLPVPTVIIQHMPKIYTQVLAEQLNEIAALEVVEARNNMKLKPGTVYLSPGSFNTVVSQINGGYFIELLLPNKAEKYRPSMDALLDSVYQNFKHRVLVVYLSGGGSDGIDGAEKIDMAGGQVIIQNKATSLLWDLPWKIQSRGINDGEYPLHRLSEEIARRIF